MEPEKTTIARQLLGEHTRGNEQARNNRRTTVFMQWRSKHASVTIEELLDGVCCVVRAEMW
jgi:hypothetical protein